MIKPNNIEFIQYNSKKLSYTRMEEILDKMSQVRTAVIGDGILDIYWEADMTLSNLSLETPHFPLPIVNERIYPGGGANVAANMAALGLKEVSLLTVIGKDWRGKEFKNILKKKRINLKYLIDTDKVITPAYCKPLRQGISDVIYEDPRLDFQNQKKLDGETEKIVIEKIRELVKEIDSIAVTDQLQYGIITGKVRKEICNLETKKVIAVDSRDSVHKFQNVIVKSNQIEAMKAVFGADFSSESSIEQWKQAALKLKEITGAPVIITMGSRGALWLDDHQLIEIPQVEVEGSRDTVGAGDSFMAAFVASRAAGARPEESLTIANLAAAVTVKKLNVTGTANREEIKKRFKEVYEEGESYDGIIGNN